MAAMARHRVVVFGPALDALSGVSTHVRVLLASDLPRDYELLHFQVGSEGRRENAAQKLLRFIVSPFHLAFFLLRTRAGVVHLNASLNPKGYWRDVTYWLVIRALGRRVVNQIHSGPMPQDFFRGNAPLTWLLRRFLVGSDVVTVLSSAELRAYHAFNSRINVHLVPNAIDPKGLTDRKRRDNPRGPLRLAYVGRLARTKGVFEIVEALGELKRAGREFTLAIGGNGPDGSALKAAVENAGIADRVSFRGFVTGEDKDRLWLESDVFVFPSYAEGLPYSLLEAMAAGCVPITTPVAAIPDVMKHKRHGLFVPVRDARAVAAAIAALDDDRGALARMSAAARQRILDQYTVVRLARDFRGLYKDCYA